jgi:uncharacterized protein (DUF1330 family)
MAGYLIANDRITNQEAYAAYPPAVMLTLVAHGAEVLGSNVPLTPPCPSPPGWRRLTGAD